VNPFTKGTDLHDTAVTRHSAARRKGVLQRLAAIEARVDATKLAVTELGARVDRPQQAPQSTATVTPGYQVAIRLARSGASREELISGCGLSRGEAELVHRLHGHSSAACVTNS
jgi:hypothetical protein